MSQVQRTLEKMRAWILKEIEKGAKPFSDGPFVLTSLVHCAYQADAEHAEEALALLREVRKEEWQMQTYDVMGPHSVLFLIGRALKTRC